MVPPSELPAIRLAEGRAHSRRRSRANPADAVDWAGMVLLVDLQATTVGPPLSGAEPKEFTVRPTRLLSRTVPRGHAAQRTRPDTRRRPTSNFAGTIDRTSEPA